MTTISYPPLSDFKTFRHPCKKGVRSFKFVLLKLLSKNYHSNCLVQIFLLLPLVDFQCQFFHLFFFLSLYFLLFEQIDSHIRVFWHSQFFQCLFLPLSHKHGKLNGTGIIVCIFADATTGTNGRRKIGVS